MSLANAFDAPLVFTIGGKSYSLALLTLEDLSNLERWYFNQKKIVEQNNLPQHDVQGRRNIEADYAFAELSTHQLSLVVSGRRGAIKVIELSLARSGIPGAASIVAGLPYDDGWIAITTIAQKLSTLWPIVREAPTPPNDGSSSPESSGQSSTAETTIPSTGSTTGSESGKPSDVIPPP